jgi:hypothetical protein
MEPRKQFQGINSTSLCSLTGLYNNNRVMVLARQATQVSRIDFLLESIPGLLKRLRIRAVLYFEFHIRACFTLSCLIFRIILSILFLFLFLASLILLALHSLQYFFFFISKVATLLFLLIFCYKLCLHSSNTIINLLFISRNLFQMQLSVVGLINDFI